MGGGGALTAPGLIQPLVSLDEGPAVWDLVVNEPAEVLKFGIRFCAHFLRQTEDSYG
jgi:hypothetical protein